MPSGPIVRDAEKSSETGPEQGEINYLNRSPSFPCFRLFSPPGDFFRNLGLFPSDRLLPC
jgi:hypothetical protein